MMRKVAVAAMFVGFGGLSLGAAMTDDQNPPPAAATAGPAAKKALPWWLTSSQEHPSSQPWLYHIDGTFSYMNGSGNTSGTSYDTSANGWIRRHRFTSHSHLQLSNKNVNYVTTRTLISYEERTLREQLDYDLTSRITLMAGVEHYRNTLMFMDKRLNVYGALGSTLFHNDKHKLTFTAGIGRAEFRFDRAAMLAVNQNAVTQLDTNPDSGGVLGMQMWTWAVSPRFIFGQDSSYMQYFDPALGHRWTINLTGTLPVNKWLAFTVNYKVKEETNVFIHALQVFPQDRMFLMGIKLAI